MIAGFSKYFEIIQKLEVVADKFGYPAKFITDKEGVFVASQFKEYCTQHEIKITGIPTKRSSRKAAYNGHKHPN